MKYLIKIRQTGLLSLVLLVVFSVSAFAQGLTPMQIANLKNVGTAVVSSDGAYVAYTVSVQANPLENNVGNSLELFVFNTESGEIVQHELERNPAGLSARPGNGTFTFTTRMGDDPVNGLYELNPSTNQTELLFSFDRNMVGYEWDPAGRRISFIAMEDLNLPENPLPYDPIIFEENRPNRLGFMVDLGRANPEAMPINIEGSFYNMAWSSDSSLLAVSVAPSPEVDDQFMFQTVFVVDASTGDVRNAINNAGKIGQITWSPDGSQLALRAGNSINDPIDGRIMVVDATGGTPENIFPGFLGKFEEIKWTAEDTIHFIASEGVWRSFGTISPDGTNFTRIVGTGGPVMYTFSVADNGDVVFVVDAPEHPREVYHMSADSNSPQRITDVNPWLADVSMGVQEIVTYSARDGLEIEGLLIRPYGENDNQRYPLITVVHGGPEAHYSNGWLTNYSLPGQLMAARGFAVFYPNYRGSTGRGLEFIKSSQGDLAGAEFDDVVDGVDHLIEIGLVDADRVGVTGGSYGGYATAWMSTYYSDRFAAGVMFVGISNNISKWGTSDIPEELYLVHSRKRIWDYWQDNLERSPIYWVERSQTPILIMHGAEDTRVHPAQSLELYRHLRVRKPEVPVRLVLYPGEGHGNTRATSRLDYNLRMIQWFETYLKEESPEFPDSHLNLSDFEIEVD